MTAATTGTATATAFTTAADIKPSKRPDVPVLCVRV
jgi:hypothetical protein